MAESNLLEELGYTRQWCDDVILVVSYATTKRMKVAISVWERDEELKHVWHPIYVAISKLSFQADDDMAWKKIGDFIKDTIIHFQDNSSILPTTCMIAQHSDPKYSEINGAINTIVDNCIDCSEMMICDETTLKASSSPQWRAKWKMVGEHPVCGQFTQEESKQIMLAVKLIDLLFNES
jgi:hypothetical protein